MLSRTMATTMQRGFTFLCDRWPGLLRPTAARRRPMGSTIDVDLVLLSIGLALAIGGGYFAYWVPIPLAALLPFVVLYYGILSLFWAFRFRNVDAARAHAALARLLSVAPLMYLLVLTGIAHVGAWMMVVVKETALAAIQEPDTPIASALSALPSLYWAYLKFAVWSTPVCLAFLAAFLAGAASFRQLPVRIYSEAPSVPLLANGIAIAVCIGLGTLGVHRFLQRRWVTGMLWFLTAGLFGVGVLADFFAVRAGRQRW